MTLTSSAVGGVGAANGNAAWTVENLPANGLPLRMRIADLAPSDPAGVSPMRGGTLLLDAGSAGGGAPAKLADLRRADTGWLHAEISDAVAASATATADLHCQHLAPHPTDGFDTEPWWGFFHPDTLADATAPHLILLPQDATKTWFEHARPGASYVASGAVGATEVDRLAFQGPSLAMPLVPMTHLEAAFGVTNKDKFTDFQSLLNSYVSAHTAKPAEVFHETRRKETAPPGDVRIANAFGPGTAPGGPARARMAAIAPAGATGGTDGFSLGNFALDHDFGDGVLKVHVTRPAGADPDFIVLEPDHGSPGQDYIRIDQLPAMALDPNWNGIQLGSAIVHPPADPSRPPMPDGILKFTRDRTLKDIFQTYRGGTYAAGFAKVLEKMPPVLQRQDWTGAVLFDLNVNTVDGLLTAVIPKQLLDDLTFRFVALSPKRGSAAGFSVTAAISMQQPDQDPGPIPAPGDPTTPPETAYQVLSLEAAWENTTLLSLSVRTRLSFKSAFGLVSPTAPKVELDGAFDRKTNKITFAARADSPIKLLPDTLDPVLPIRQIYVRGGTIGLVKGVARVSLDGSVDIGTFSIPGLPEISAGDSSSIDFTGLGLRLPSNLPPVSWLSLDYPSLKLNFDGPKFSIGPLQITFASIGIDFANLFDWGRLIPIAGNKPMAGKPLLLGLHIELMKLPAIAGKTLERLTFNLQLGLPGKAGFGSWDLGKAYVALGALGFDKLDLDLFRFIEISAEKVEFAAPAGTPPITKINVTSLTIKVLDYPIVKNITAFFFSRQGESGFYLFDPTPAGSLDGIQADWVLIGHNVHLDPSVTMKLLEIDPGTGEDDSKPPTIVGEPIPALPGQGGNWLIGAGVSALGGLFIGRFIYDETGTIGLALKAGFLEEWFGLDLAVAVQYARGPKPSENVFSVALTIPQFTIGLVDFMGGVVAFDFQVDGGFMLDLGYPWPSGTTRLWNRALGAILDPFQGSGGFYIERRNLTINGPTVLASGTPQTLTHLAGGYAVQAGLGAAFGAGVLTAWVTIGITVALDGDVYLNGNKLVAARITGAVGILFRGHAELNFWIISISIDITIGAEASATIAWASDAAYAGLVGAPGGGKAQLRIEFTVYASASASACIRLGFVHLCRGISVTIPMRASYVLTL